MQGTSNTVRHPFFEAVNFTDFTDFRASAKFVSLKNNGGNSFVTRDLRKKATVLLPNLDVPLSNCTAAISSATMK